MPYRKLLFVDDLPVQVVNERPVGATNGVNSSFAVLRSYRPGTLVVWLNGLRQASGTENDYVELTDTVFQFTVPPHAGDTIVVDYTATPTQ